AGAAERRAPLVVLTRALTRQQRDAVADLEQARNVLGALDVARHPEKIVGGPAQHVTPMPMASPLAPRRGLPQGMTAKADRAMGAGSPLRHAGCPDRGAPRANACCGGRAPQAAGVRGTP